MASRRIDPRFRIARTLAIALLAVAALSLPSCVTARAPSPVLDTVLIGSYGGGPLVRTEFGYLRGVPDKDACWAWRGIPYAKPPVGDLRWRAPAPPEPWEGVRSAKKFGRSAVQFLPLIERLEGSEDCLFLNVWRPADNRERLPVVVWIHGGANTAGSSTSFTDYYGHALASSQSLVFVSVNYRLGPLGWFSDPGLAAEAASAEEASGNFGLLDIIAALRWIQSEIPSFGGDPSRVTVMGESAGALDVLALLCASGTEGLFSGAVAMSPITGTRSMEDARARSEAVLAGVIKRDRARKGSGYKDPVLAASEAVAMAPSERPGYLRAAKPGKIYATLHGGITGMADWPAVYPDGALLPAAGIDSLASGELPAKVPLIIGSTRDEVGAFLFIEHGFRFKDPEYADAIRYGSELWRARYVDSIARGIASNESSSPVYSYRFEWGSRAADGTSLLPFDFGARVGAFHGLDVPFFLGTDTVIGPILGKTVFTNANRESREALSERIVSYIGAFARTGNPNAEGTEPAWPEFGIDAAWLAFGDPDAPDLASPRSGSSSVDAVVERMVREIGERSARRALSRLPFFMKGFPFQED